MAYITWADLIQYTIMIAQVVTTCYIIFSDNDKK